MTLTRLCHNIGYTPNNPNYNTPEEIRAALERGERLTFDGVYQNVYANRRIFKDYPNAPRPILFIMGDGVGGDNAFDAAAMPMEMFCTWDQIFELASDFGFELGWHTHNHPNLTKVCDGQLLFEVTPPFPMNYFAYPYGAWDDRVKKAVSDVGFCEAYLAGPAPGAGIHTLPRAYL